MAEQLEFFELQSPCRGICQTNEQGYCRGCYRTRDERFNWINYSDSQKEICYVFVVSDLYALHVNK